MKTDFYNNIWIEFNDAKNRMIDEMRLGIFWLQNVNFVPGRFFTKVICMKLIIEFEYLSKTN